MFRPPPHRLETALLLTLTWLLCASPVGAQSVSSYSISIREIGNLEQLRPLIQACRDLGVLQTSRTLLLESDDLEVLRPAFRSTAAIRVSGCPAGLEASGISPVSETELDLEALLRRTGAASAEPLQGLDFSLRDVERQCEVYKYSERYGEVDCRGSALREVERRCEVYFPSPSAPELDCRRSVLRPVERRCSVRMYSDQYGEIDCSGGPIAMRGVGSSAGCKLAESEAPTLALLATDGRRLTLDLL